MKKFSLWTTAIVVAGLFLAPGLASAQEAQTKAAPHQIGLIDLAHIFKNYEKFKDKTQSLQTAAEDAEAKAQGMLEQMKQIQGQLQSGNIAAGSVDYNKLEAQLIKLQTELQTFRQVEQRDIVRKQADVYKQIYLEVQDAVGQYAKYYKYTLIMRFNRQEVSEAVDPQTVMQGMNRQVVYYQNQDDLTDPILNFLNEKYRKTASAQ